MNKEEFLKEKSQESKRESQKKNQSVDSPLSRTRCGIYLEERSDELSKNGSTYLKIKVVPNAQKTEIAEILNGEETLLKLRIKSVPEKGKANKEIEKFLGKHFSGKAKIINGHINSIKLVQITK